MRAGKSHQEDEEYEEEEFGSKKEGPSSTPNSNGNNKDATAIDKASAIRSKHSVTEQRRRSKINERFQILRDLIPHSDQKRDTASFLLEVIDYVQYLQEKVQKYEGSYQGWSQEPTKLMPWRNSHWRAQSFVGQPQPVKNGLGPISPFPGKFDEGNLSVSPTMLSGSQNMIDPDQSNSIVSKTAERQPESASRGVPPLMPMHSNMSVPVRSDGIGVHAHPLQGPFCDALLTECPATSEPQNQQDELTIEGGTISISSVYSQGWAVTKIIAFFYFCEYLLFLGFFSINIWSIPFSLKVDLLYLATFNHAGFLLFNVPIFNLLIIGSIVVCLLTKYVHNIFNNIMTYTSPSSVCYFAIS